MICWAFAVTPHEVPVPSGWRSLILLPLRSDRFPALGTVLAQCSNSWRLARCGASEQTLALSSVRRVSGANRRHEKRFRT